MKKNMWKYGVLLLVAFVVNAISNIFPSWTAPWYVPTLQNVVWAIMFVVVYGLLFNPWHWRKEKK